MQTTAEQLQHWLAEPEGIHLEFKEAKQNYHFEKLVEYCVALANEGGSLVPRRRSRGIATVKRDLRGPTDQRASTACKRLIDKAF
ncbi:MAG: AlbA family DNA-binding domain-containing protein [Lysobacterales bacterium]